MIEEALSKTADTFEELVENDRALLLETETLLMAGQSPQLTRVIRLIDRAEIVIIVRDRN